MSKVVKAILLMDDGSVIEAEVSSATFSNPGSFGPMYEGFTPVMKQSWAWDVMMRIEQYAYAPPGTAEEQERYVTRMARQARENKMPLKQKDAETRKRFDALDLDK
jgi:hypothetical protein